MPMYQPFKALAQGQVDFDVEVEAIHLAGTDYPVMTLMTHDAAIYITRDQAMEFFGLVPSFSQCGKQ